MDISVTYQPTAKELANASSLFIEKKPFLRLVVTIVNVMAGLLVIIMVTKLFVMGLIIQEWGVLFGSLVWIFGRRPFNEWLLYKKMLRSGIMDKPLTIDFSLNGIVWSGEALKNGQLSWAQVKYVMLAQNGFVLPHSSTRFLWAPFRAFKNPNEVEVLKSMIQEQHIQIREYPKWVC